MGILNAGVALPDYPAECREATPHAAISEGMDAVSVLVRERGQLDKANKRAHACGPGFYDSVTKEFNKSARAKGEHPLPRDLQR